MTRKLDNWLLSYLEWNLARTDAPESFLYVSGLFAISSAIRRQIYISDLYLGGWTCYPFLYIMFVGPPGSRKTTAIKKADDILDELEHTGLICRGPDQLSQAALIDELVKSPDGSVYITSHEFGELIRMSKDDMFTVLTGLFDGKRTLKSKTMARNVELADAPCINLIAGTTESWIQENMSEAVIGGGFASRVIFVHEDGPRIKKLIYKDVDIKGLKDKYHSKLVSDLKQIATLKGEMHLDQDAEDWLVAWNEKEEKPTNRHLHGFHERKSKHLMSFAMLLHIARSDELILQKQDFELALSVLDVYVEKRLMKVFGGIGKNPYIYTSKDIYEYVLAKKKVSKPDVLDQFNAAATPDWIERVIQSLLDMKKVKEEYDPVGKLTYYLPAG